MKWLPSPSPFSWPDIVSALSYGHRFPSSTAAVRSSSAPSSYIWFISSQFTALTVTNLSSTGLRSGHRCLQEYRNPSYPPLSWRDICSCTAVQRRVRCHLFLSSFPAHRTSSALIADVWGPKERGVALAAFVVAPFAGPGIGPTIGGYIVQSGAHWRWVLWVVVFLVSLLQLSRTNLLILL